MISSIDAAEAVRLRVDTKGMAVVGGRIEWDTMTAPWPFPSKVSEPLTAHCYQAVFFRVSSNEQHESES